MRPVEPAESIYTLATNCIFLSFGKWQMAKLVAFGVDSRV